MNINGKESVVIPLCDNPALYRGSRGVYLNITMVKSRPNDYGSSHLICASIENARLRETLTETDRITKAPVLGYLKQVEKKTKQAQQVQEDRRGRYASRGQYDPLANNSVNPAYESIDMAEAIEIGDMPL